jgi:peptidoglycan/LPS O-acetylase OafA/YrhL
VPRFYLSRALRIYPVYAIAAVANMALLTPGLLRRPLTVANQLLLLPEAIWRNLRLDMGVDGNGLALGLFYTVALEMMFYLLAPFIVLRSLGTLFALWALALAAHLLPFLLGAEARAWQYEFFPTTLVFFITGCLSYRLYRQLRRVRFAEELGYLSLVAIPAYCVWADFDITGDFANDLTAYGLYVLVALATPILFRASRHSVYDNFLGELAYPVYAVHTIVLGVLLRSAWHGAPYEFAVALILTALPSVLLVFLIERPVDRFRAALSRPPTGEAPTLRPALAPADPAQQEALTH